MIDTSTGYFRAIDFERGLPKGCTSFEVTEILRFFQSSTELIDPDTSRIKRLLSEIGIDTALAGEGAATTRVAPSPARARIESLLSRGMGETLEGLGTLDQSFRSPNMALLAGGPKAKILDPIPLILRFRIHGHSEACMRKFWLNHIFKMISRITPTFHHRRNGVLPSGDVLGHHGFSLCIHPFVPCALHSLSRG